ncbi:MAG: 23S rRNA (pseudouridine(1915)-N(3))-methyltransferase RlmH [Bacteroidales bacterium]|nr:23S rRNA (pseudouridine(1915)-N(3))-methyltransferase RlmH [Bacteroidales bacterium]
MKISVLNIGATDIAYLQEGIDHYLKRLKHYIPVEMTYVSATKAGKSATPDFVKEKEGSAIIRHLAGVDVAVLLDERGRQMTSEGFAKYLQQIMNRGAKSLVFITGGAYGFSNEVYDRVNERISMSSMTFPHQLIRLVFLEQLYRAFTILKGESYHHI